MQLKRSLGYVCYLMSVFLLSCKGKKNADIDVVKNLSPATRLVVDSIANFPTVDAQIVGIGVPSKQYARFLNLAKQSSEKELITLTDHPNQNVRAYAFWGLGKRNYGHLQSLLDKHISDTALVSFFSGCFINKYPINKFFLTVVTPQSPFIDCKKLSEQELRIYNDKIKSK